MATPAPKFPAAIVDDSWLTIATNQLQTRLAVPCGAADTTIGVVDASRIVQWSLLTLIDSTNGAPPAGVSEIVLVTQPPAGNILTVRRGYDGSTAAAHSAGIIVSGYIVGWHQRSLAGEVKAIEQALGANLSNVGAGVPGVQISSKFSFPPQFPGGNLVIGNNSIVLAPVPPGVNGTDQNHYLYVDQGTGTPEPVLITGGSAVGGTPSGTVIINCHNTHSGAWRISSATAGIQEAAGTPYSYVVVPPGHYDIYATIAPAVGCTLDGLGVPTANGPSASVFLHLRTAGIPLIDVVNVGTCVKNFQLAYGAFPDYKVNGVVATPGSIGLQSGVNGNQDATGITPLLVNLVINNFYTNLYNSRWHIDARDIISLEAISDGIIAGPAGSGYYVNILSQSSQGHGIRIKANGAAAQWESVACFNNKGFGIYVEDAAAFQIDNIDCEGDWAGEISIGSLGTPSAIIQNVILQAAGYSTSWGTNLAAPGLQIRSSATVCFLTASNLQISACAGNGIEIAPEVGGTGASVQLIGLYLSVNGAGNQPGSIYNLSASGNFVFIDNMMSFAQGILLNASGGSVEGSSMVGPCSSSASDPLVTFGANANGFTFAGNSVFNATHTAISYVDGCSFINGVNSVVGAIIGDPHYSASYHQTLALTQLPGTTVLTVSANSIMVSLPLHHVGAGLIRFINSPPTIVQPYSVKLIADAAFTTDTAGNIATPAMTAIVGRLYEAAYDPATSKWYFSS